MREPTASAGPIDRETALATLDRADRLPMAEVVHDLVAWIGLGLTALAGGVHETRFVHPWLHGKQPRRAASLRAAWRAAAIITALYGAEAAKAWFVGQQLEFDFQSPIRVLQANTDEVRTAVVRSAVRFATT